MECAYHPNREAVDICFVCNKHICAECSQLLTGKVICKQCKTAVASRLLDRLRRQQAEERKFAYSLPAASILMAVTFLLISISIGLFVPIGVIGLILLAIGIFFFVIIYTGRKKQHYISGEKLTRKRKIGWAVFSIGILSLVIVLPIVSLLFDSGLITTVLSIGISFALIIIGLVLTES
jgi:uncharacterized membrane protein